MLLLLLLLLFSSSPFSNCFLASNCSLSPVFGYVIALHGFCQNQHVQLSLLSMATSGICICSLTECRLGLQMARNQKTEGASRNTSPSAWKCRSPWGFVGTTTFLTQGFRLAEHCKTQRVAQVLKRHPVCQGKGQIAGCQIVRHLQSDMTLDIVLSTTGQHNNFNLYRAPGGGGG